MEQTRRPAETPIVGIGTSAGGLSALQHFLPAVDAQGGLAFVVVQHLDPAHESNLATIIARWTPLPVATITDGALVAPNHVYVIPPDAEPRSRAATVDTFLISLARDQGRNAACVILSGTGSDGTIGLRAIKEHGGVTFAQADAEYDGMMRSALATGLVDLLLPAGQIPAKLAEHFRHMRDATHRQDLDQIENGPSEELDKVIGLLRGRTGHDFKGYKAKTVIRRIRRRMEILQVHTIGEFVDRLRKEPRELDLLFQDLLIGVTSFFRDPAVFAALEKDVIPELFAGRGATESVRVWIPGCATGEEAYSIAILLREAATKLANVPKLQVFASDIDDAALEIARAGRYPATIEKYLSSERLAAYFIREDGTCRVTGDLREMCLFATHNLLRDAPFSKVDLISCRNLLIYLDADIQNRVIPLFHYALTNKGFLLLGPSENVSRHARLFTTVDKPQRIFRKRTLPGRNLPEFPLTATDSLRHRQQSHARPASAANLTVAAERLILDHFGPSYAVVTADGDLLHASARTGKYLELAPGVPSTNVVSMARRGLRLDLRTALHRAAKGGQAVTIMGLSVRANGSRQAIDLTIQPLPGHHGEDRNYLVVFQDVGAMRHDDEGEADHDHEESGHVRNLEDELSAAHERLQTATEELESSNEELKSGNEELSSMNEELQSANEELEISREELQSINEELQTVNGELTARVDELSRANSDISNLLESTQIATIFLDTSMRVKSFTPAAKDVFRIVESDAGRPISHLRARVGVDSLQQDAELVLRTLRPVERQVAAIEDDNRYMMRTTPYRTTDNVISGVVITFTDITRISAAEARISQLTRSLRDRVESLEKLLDLVPVGIFIKENASEEIRINRCAAELLGVTL
jgi:two-component system CheB/CheR fusion protein